MVPIKNKAPTALRMLRDFNASEILESEVHHIRNGCKWNLFLFVSTVFCYVMLVANMQDANNDKPAKFLRQNFQLLLLMIITYKMVAIL